VTSLPRSFDFRVYLFFRALVSSAAIFFTTGYSSHDIHDQTIATDACGPNANIGKVLTLYGIVRLSLEGSVIYPDLESESDMLFNNKGIILLSFRRQRNDPASRLFFRELEKGNQILISKGSITGLSVKSKEGCGLYKEFKNALIVIDSHVSYEQNANR
jgi:hypothetical protein